MGGEEEEALFLTSQQWWGKDALPHPKCCSEGIWGRIRVLAGMCYFGHWSFLCPPFLQPLQMWQYLQLESVDGQLKEVLKRLQISGLLPLAQEEGFERQVLAPLFGADSAPSGMRMAK